jgi:2-oxo-3-hexenedioate decarboxylase
LLEHCSIDVKSVSIYVNTIDHVSRIAMSQTHMNTHSDPERLAAILDEAARGALAVDCITLTHSIDLKSAYYIQKLSIARRLGRGEHLVGIKMGFTSVAKMRQMGVDEAIWGRLTDAMALPNGGKMIFSRYVHPRVEPEVAFLLKHPLVGVVSREQALAAVEAMAPAAEIIDSRFRDFKFTHFDVVADNCSSSSFVLGDWRSPCDLSDLAVSLDIDSEAKQTGSTAAILGDPLLSLVAAAKLAQEGGDSLQAGWVVMAGAATAAVALEPGMHVHVSVESLGDVGFSVVP